jgi:hypothetical protein
VVSFPQLSPPKLCTRLSPPPYVLHAPPHLILLDFITRTILGEEHISHPRALSTILRRKVKNANKYWPIFVVHIKTYCQLYSVGPVMVEDDRNMQL